MFISDQFCSIEKSKIHKKDVQKPIQYQVACESFSWLRQTRLLHVHRTTYLFGFVYLDTKIYCTSTIPVLHRLVIKQFDEDATMVRRILKYLQAIAAIHTASHTIPINVTHLLHIYQMTMIAMTIKKIQFTLRLPCLCVPRKSIQNRFN